MSALLNSIVPAAIAYTIPLLMGALGGLYSERSGVTNLCIEGLMLMGCFVCAVVMTLLEGTVSGLALLAAGLAAAVFFTAVYSILHAVASINLKADQTISGTAINMLSTALTVYLARALTNSGNITIHGVVPASIEEFLPAGFHNLLWSVLAVVLVCLLLSWIVKLATGGKKKASVTSGLVYWILEAAMLALVLSLFLPEMAASLIAAALVAADSLVLRKKGLFASVPVLKTGNSAPSRDSAFAAVMIIIAGLISVPGFGSFFRNLLFRRVYWTTVVCLLIWGASYFLLYKTSFGLRLRACGEHPSAVASAGVNVYKMRYIGVIASGALAGLGGAVYLVTVGGEFNSASGMNGLGFLAIAGLIFGQWKPLGILGSTFFFGFCYTMANMSRIVPALSFIPAGIFSAFPYVATLIVLIFTSKRNAAPLASGVPY